MRSTARRLTGVAVVAAVACAFAAGAPSRSARATAPTTPPFLVRDVEAGHDTLNKHRGPEQPDTAIEPSIAVNPKNPLNAVAVYQIGRVDGGGDADNGFATTFDGGATWITGSLPGLTRNVGGDFDRASDAVVAFGPDGTVYADSLVFDDVTGNGLRSGLANNVSHDGGRTWGPPIVLQDDQGLGLNDKNWIVVDQSDAPGHHQGRVYVVWDRVAPVLVNYSDDQGQTWLPVFSVIYPGQGIGSIPLVLPDGSLAVVFDTAPALLPPLHPSASDDIASLSDTGAGSIVMSVAPLAGSTPTGVPLVFLPPVTVAAYKNNPVRVQRAATLPMADVDPATGRVYVVWEDARFRQDLANDIVISSSTDHITFTPPAKVNPGGDNDNVDHWNATVAVGSGGSVQVAYRQRQEAKDEKNFSPFVDTEYQQSADQGVSFTKPLQVNEIRTNVVYAAFSRHGAFLGDYNQVATGGPLTYIVRDEAYATRALATAAAAAGKPTTLDFKIGHQHQTTWVAVVQSAGAATAAPAPVTPAAAPGAPAPAPTQVAAARVRSHLPATGGRTDPRPALLALLGAVALATHAHRRPARARKS